MAVSPSTLMFLGMRQCMASRYQADLSIYTETYSKHISIYTYFRDYIFLRNNVNRNCHHKSEYIMSLLYSFICYEDDNLLKH